MNTNRDRFPLLSVIVPVYNVEEYLPCCIDSILSQTFTDFELILVDDGSQDRSGDICDDYAQKDSRIKVIHKENGGAGSARNAGLDKSRGAYIMFVDPDDKLGTIDTIEKNLYILRKYTDYCFVQFPALWNYGKTSDKILSHEKKIYTDKNSIFQAFFNSQITNVVWDKIYNSKLFESVRFPNLKYYEDDYLITDILKNVDRVILSDQGFYDYCIRAGSAMTSDISPKKLEDFFCVITKNIGIAISVKGTESYRVKATLRMVDKLAYVKNLIGEDVFMKYCSQVKKVIPRNKEIIHFMLNDSVKLGTKLLIIKTVGASLFLKIKKMK